MNVKNLSLQSYFTTRDLYFIENNSLKNEIYYENPNHNPQGILESNSTKAIP